MLRRAEEAGLKPGGTIVEATSGNTGASLALFAAVRGYKCVFVMPDKMSQEKIANLRAFGARVVVCPTAVEPEDPRSYYQVSKRIADGDAELVLREPVPQPREPRGALHLDGPRDLAADRRRPRRVRRGHGHGRNDQRHRQVPQGEEARRQARRRRSGRLALLRLRQDGPHHEGVFVQGRGHRRGLLPDDDEPQDPRRHRARRRQGVLPHDARPHAPRGALRRRLAAARRSRARSSRRASTERPARRSSSSCATPVRSTSRRSSTTTGCARTASSTSSRGSARCAISSARVTRKKIVTVSPTSTVQEAIDVAEIARHQPAPGRRGGQASRHRGGGRPPAAPRERQEDARLARSAISPRATTRRSRPTRRSSCSRTRSSDAKVAMVTEGEELVGIVTKIDLIDFLAKSSS